MVNAPLNKPSAVLFLCTSANFLLFVVRYYTSLPPPKWLFFVTGYQLPALVLGLALYLFFKFIRQKKRPPLALYAVIPVALANYWLFAVIFADAVRIR